MKEVENPWKEFKKLGDPEENREYVLKKDRAGITSIPSKLLSLKQYPEPFIGDPNAPVYLLNLNPGSKDSDIADMKSLKSYIEKNYIHDVDANCPFYYLRENLKKTGGGKWWREKFTKEVIKDMKDGKLIKDEKDVYMQISKKVFCIEYFPYHSEKAGFKSKIAKHFTPLNTYQEYTKYLVENAIEKKKTILIMRNQDLWYELVEKLNGYKKLFFCKYTRRSWISRGNIDGFDEILKILKS